MYKVRDAEASVALAKADNNSSTEKLGLVKVPILPRTRPPSATAPPHSATCRRWKEDAGQLTLADLDCKLGRDAEGAENRDAHSNMVTRGLGILGAGAWPLPHPLNPPVSVDDYRAVARTWLLGP